MVAGEFSQAPGRLRRLSKVAFRELQSTAYGNGATNCDPDIVKCSIVIGSGVCNVCLRACELAMEGPRDSFGQRHQIGLGDVTGEEHHVTGASKRHN
jgi:hypothetical protein